MLDLFGEPITEPWPVPFWVKGKERSKKGRRKKRRDPVPKGYARIPGTGPKGETCGSCDHAMPKRLSRKWVYKCACNRLRWTHGRGTDILLKSPACVLWTMRWEPENALPREDPMACRRRMERAAPFIDHL